MVASASAGRTGNSSKAHSVAKEGLCHWSWREGLSLLGCGIVGSGWESA